MSIEELAKQIYKDKKLDTTSKINKYLNKYHKDLNDSEIRFIHEYCVRGYVTSNINLYTNSYI